MTIFDRIRDTSTTAGTALGATATFTVSGTAPSGYQTFSARFAVNDANIPVVIAHQTANEWQVCWCTYTTTNTLRVDTVIFSSNADAGVNFSAGTKDVFVSASSRAFGGIREANVWTGNNTFTNTGLKLQDTNASHVLTIAPGSNITADRTLTITTGDASRTITLNGDTTLNGTNSGDQTITLTGNVTGSGTGSFATTIANSAVTLARMADLAQNRVIGRVTASTGVPEALTPDNIITVVNAASTNTINFARLSGAAASSHNQAWSTITSTPTTLSGYGITDGVLKSGDTLTGRLIQSSSGFGCSQKDDITTRTDSGYFETSSATTGEGWPETTNNWYHLLNSTHSNQLNYYSMQFAADFFNSNKLYFRCTNSSGSTAWNLVWHAGNDGTGSGLDADTLDGIQASSFATISGTETLSNKTLTSPTINGGTIQSRPQASSETTGTLTSASANKTIQATGGITINNSVFSAGDIIVIYAGASSRTLTQGSGVTMRLAGTATTGNRTLAARAIATLFFVSASEVVVGGTGVT